MNNRLQKKCFVASAGLHLLLASILILGSAFLAAPKKAEPTAYVHFIPDFTTDEHIMGGGTPSGGPPPPPVPPVRTPDPAPTPAVSNPRPPTPTPPPPRPSTATKAPMPLPLRPDPRGTRPASQRTDNGAAAQAAAQARAQQLREALNNRIGQSLTGIGGLSHSTELHFSDGIGGGGRSYANFLDTVRSRYEEAWFVPDGVTDDNATTEASVTIARNGDVISARVTRSSGNGDVDASVREVLQRVKFVAPLPEASSDSQRTVEINFNVKAKRGLG